MRLAWWTAGLLLGISCALLAEATPRIAICSGVPAATAALVLVLRRRGTWAEILVAAAVGVYVGARAAEVSPLPTAVTALVDQEGEGRAAALPVLAGWVLAAPEGTADGTRQGSRLRIRLDRIDGATFDAGRTLTAGVSVVSGVPPVLPGDRVQFAARLRSVRGLANPGVADGAFATRAAGIDVFAGVASAAAIQIVSAEGAGGTGGAPAGLGLLRAAARVRLVLGQSIDRSVAGAARVLLHTAVLGERRATDATVEAGFRAAGATHLLSVSGLHLAAIALVFFGGVRVALAWIPRLPLWLSARQAAAVVAIPAIAFYTLVTGAAVATVRSALMMTFALAGTAIGRRSTAAGAIGAAVLLLLAWSPLVVADISFQLSLVSVLALTWLAPRPSPDAARTPDRAAGWPRRYLLRPALRWGGGLAAASLAAGVTTAPLVAHTFGEVAPGAPLGNLLLVPLVELILVPSGLVGAIVGATAGPTAATPFLLLAETAGRVALGAAELFRLHVPVWLTRMPGSFDTIGLSAGSACALIALRRPRQAPYRRAWALAAAALLGAALVSLTVQEVRRRFGDQLIVTFLDVGQGDAAVIQAPGGRTVLIDAGGTYDGSFDPGARVVEPFLRAHGIVRLDLVALSHPHPDHQGGLHRILARFPVGTLWTSGDDGRNPDYHLLMREARAAAIATPPPARWQAGGLTLEPLGPFVVADGAGGASERVGPTAGVSVNDASLVLRAAFAGSAVLFTGDVEADGEGELRGRTSLGQTIASQVLKVPHHGSRTSSSDELLDAVRPALAVMSLGWRNRFRFPRPEVVARYRARGIRLLRTDLNGAVTVTITGDGQLSTSCARSCAPR